MTMFAHILKKDPEVKEMSVEVYPQTCDGCLWRREVGGTCDAFPDGIPVPILLGAFDHRSHYEDDVATDDGLTFEPAFAE